MVTRSDLKVLILFLLITISVCAKTTQTKKNQTTKTEPVKSQEHNYTRARSVMKEIPTKKDLLQYLRSINKIIKFCDVNRNEIDLNFAFGLFLINVNLKTVVRHKAKHIPITMKRLLKETLFKNDEILGFFNSKVKRDTNPANKINKLLYSLFSNESVWIERLVRYDNSAFPGAKRSSDQEMQNIYSTWENYQKYIDNWQGLVPNEKQSDECIASLAHNQVRVFESLPTCNLAELCYNIVVNGSDYGYALTHRILLLLSARYGRGCAVFSPTTDRELMNRFCAAAYVEAEYIAAHNFAAIDLLMEQITFCALEGHFEFLQRSWINRVLRYQQPMGCFGPGGTSEKRRQRKWEMSKTNHELLGGFCNGHLTATASAAISTAIRIIVATSPDITDNDFQ